MVLMMALDRTGRRVKCNARGSIKIIPRPLIAHPWTSIAGAPEREPGCRIVHAGDPNGAAAGLPLIALWPRLAAGLAGCRDCKCPPHFLAVLGSEGHHETSYAKF